MSIFDFPRINFSGTTWFNPGTANNNSLGPGTELTYTSVTETVQPVTPTAGMSDPQITQWLQSTVDIPGMGTVLNAQWNYYGDQSFRFTDVRVSSIALGYGKLITRAEEDPLIGAVVFPNYGIMCDNNPEGFDTTQFFMETLELRAPGVFAPNGIFVSRKPSRAATIRGLNWDRNVSFHAGVDNTSGGAGGASGTFQSVIEIDPRDLLPLEGAAGGTAAEVVRHKLLPGPRASTGLQALLALWKGPRPPQGLVFRFNLYLTYPRISDTELAANFAKGIFTENPAIGRTCGSITPWYGEEPKSSTLGRFLGKASTFSNPYTTSRQYYLSGIVARVDSEAKQIVLDAVDSLPEDGPDGAKFDLGTVELGIRDATAPNTDPGLNTSPVFIIGTLRNDQQTYVNQGGIWEVPYGHLSAEQQAFVEESDKHRFELVLQTSRFGVLLYEQEYHVEPSSKCNYLDELPPGQRWSLESMKKELSGQPRALRGVIKLYVWRKGKPFTGKVSTWVQQWQITPTGKGGPGARNKYLWPSLLENQTIELENGAEYPLLPKPGADGTMASGKRAGLRLYRFVPQAHWPRQLTPEALDWGLTDEFFVTQRVLPYDDYSKIPDEELDFPLIYQEIFRNYYLLMPAMNKRLDLSDPSIWESPTAANYLLRVTEPRLWNYYDYMPRTRDLSKYRLELLRRFCKRILSQGGLRHGQGTRLPVLKRNEGY
jgi:hypothetical protein